MQLEAIGTALLLIKKLPDNTYWSLTVTDDDCTSNPSVLNIYFRDDVEADDLAKILNLGEPVDFDLRDEYVSWRLDTLMVSLIHHKEKSHEQR